MHLQSVPGTFGKISLRRHRSAKTKVMTHNMSTNNNVENWLKEADNIKKQLDSRRPLSEGAVYRLREELKIEHTYDSNAIEGSKLTLRETALVVKEGVTISGRPIEHMNAARGYAMGFDAIFDFVERKRPLSEGLIQDFHRYVMLGANPIFCGCFRDTNVRIAGTQSRCPDFALVPFLIRELIDWWNSENEKMHPIEAAARFHCRLEDIHPFVDGNGRCGRLLLNYQLVRAGLWPVNIRYDEERLRYYDALEQWDRTQNADALISLICEREIAQLSLCLEIADAQQRAASDQKPGASR